MTAIGIHAIASFDDDGNPQVVNTQPLVEADVVIAIDVDTRREKILSGTELLERIVETGDSEQLAILRVELDEESPELELLVAAIKIVEDAEQ